MVLLFKDCALRSFLRESKQPCKTNPFKVFTSLPRDTAIDDAFASAFATYGIMMKSCWVTEKNSMKHLERLEDFSLESLDEN